MCAQVRNELRSAAAAVEAAQQQQQLLLPLDQPANGIEVQAAAQEAVARTEVELQQAREQVCAVWLGAAWLVAVWLGAGAACCSMWCAQWLLGSRQLLGS